MEPRSSATTRNTPSPDPLELLLRGSKSSAHDDDRKPPRRVSSALRWFVALLLATLFAFGEYARTNDLGSVLIVVALGVVLIACATFVETGPVRITASGMLVAVSMAHVHYGAAPLPALATVVLALFVLALGVTKTDHELK